MTLTRRATILSVASLAACGGGGSAPGSPPPSPPPTPAAGCWRTMPGLPFAVQEIYPALHLNRIHIAGGLLAAGVSDGHVAYDPAIGASTALAGLPAKRHHPQAIDCLGKLYLLGGFGSLPDTVTWIMSADTLAYNDTANTWSTLTPAPEPHAEAVSAVLGGRIHIAGGRRPQGVSNSDFGDHEDVTHHLVFDPASNSWSSAAPCLAPRNSAAGAVINGLWHVAGGRTVTGGTTDAHEVYDPSADRWRIAAPMPAGAGAGGSAAAVLDSALYVFGGEFHTGAGGVRAEVWRYSPAADAWTSAAAMPTPRHGLGAVAFGASIYTVGGARQTNIGQTSNIVERFTLACA